MQPFFDQKQKKISPPDHVVISETLPLPLVDIHGHLMNPPPLTMWYMDAPLLQFTHPLNIRYPY